MITSDCVVAFSVIELTCMDYNYYKTVYSTITRCECHIYLEDTTSRLLLAVLQYSALSHTAYARYPGLLIQYETICEAGSVIGCWKGSR